MSGYPDPIKAGLARGWKVFDAQSNNIPTTFECDVAIIGTGAGGGITAEILANAGLTVLLIEEGPLKSSSDFNMKESEAYPQLYQESAARKTKDKAINILQCRTVGGSTTVNWTSSFRTPTPTLTWWQEKWGLKQYNPEQLATWFAQAERRLNIGPWSVPPNQNNDLLRLGAAKLGIPAAAISRNVKACANLGYCGMGCPVNAKQSMLITTIPAALDRGATLLTKARAHKLLITGKKVDGIEVAWLDERGLTPNGVKATVRAKHYVLAGGSINSPAVLLRSGAPDPAKLVGKRTFLHPTVVSSSIFKDRVDGFEGAPQTIYTDHFLETQAIDGPLGFKIEAPPVHPLLFASTTPGFGVEHAEHMKNFRNTHVLIALIRDGFHEQSPGGSVHLRSDGTPELDYPLNETFFESARRALLAMAEIQFAAGAQNVLPVHEQAQLYNSWEKAKAAILSFPLKPLLTKVVSAHVMGGLPMSDNESRGLVRPDGQYMHLENLSVHDGSVFPTSIGANPQLSIYGIVTRLSNGLSQRLTGKTDAGLVVNAN